MLIPERGPKGITLIRLPPGGAYNAPPPNMADVFPLWPGGKTDARLWRPDATTAQQWNWGLDAAQSPLASGAEAAKHLRSRGVGVQVEALITDTPMIPIGTLGGLPGVRRADDILAGLVQFCELRQWCAVISPIKVIAQAYIADITLLRTPGDGDGYRVSFTVVPIKTYSAKTLASIDDAAARVGAAKTLSGGVVIG